MSKLVDKSKELADARKTSRLEARPSHPNCDGCARGLPVNEHGNHEGDHPWDLQGCTADRYVLDKKP